MREHQAAWLPPVLGAWARRLREWRGLRRRVKRLQALVDELRERVAALEKTPARHCEPR